MENERKSFAVNDCLDFEKRQRNRSDQGSVSLRDHLQSDFCNFEGEDACGPTDYTVIVIPKYK